MKTILRFTRAPAKYTVFAASEVRSDPCANWSMEPLRRRNTDVLDSWNLATRHRLRRQHSQPRSLATRFTMRTILALASLLACLISTAYATALTYRLEAHEKACYFAQVEHKGTKLAFYFAVRPASHRMPTGNSRATRPQSLSSRLASCS